MNKSTSLAGRLFASAILFSLFCLFQVIALDVEAGIINGKDPAISSSFVSVSPNELALLVDNPDLIIGPCENLDVILILDESGSIDVPDDNIVRNATLALAQALQAGGGQLAIIEFSSASSISDIDGAGPGAAGYRTVDAGYVSELSEYLFPGGNNPPLPGTSGYIPSGNTNWEAAFDDAISLNSSRVADLVIFLTDGNPTAYVNPDGSICSPCSGGAVAQAVPKADLIKSAGSHMFALAIGNNINLSNISAVTGPEQDLVPGNADGLLPTTADYANIPFSELEACFNDIIVESCSPTINLEKTVYLGHDSGASFPGVELVTGSNGAAVTYCFEISNTGDTDLALVSFQDAILGIDESDLSVISGSWPLVPGGTIVYYYETTIDGPIQNIASIQANPVDDQGNDLGLSEVIDFDTASVEELADPCEPDLTPPSIVCPPDADVACGEDTEPASTGKAGGADDCGIVFINHQDVILPVCGQTFTIERTWTVHDEAQNSSSCVQLISVLDTVPPTFDNVPADATVDCTEVPQPAEVTASDNCGEATVELFEESTDGCPYFITRTYRATDDCGNTALHTQTITVVDTSAPELSEYPADTTVECDAIPAPQQLIATDNCDSDVPVDFEESEVLGECDGEKTITRTWTATDDCGNSNVHAQILTVVDTTAPAVLMGQTDAALSCVDFICDYGQLLDFEAGLLSQPERQALRQCVVGQFFELGLTPIEVLDNCNEGLDWDETDVEVIVYEECNENITAAVICYFEAVDDCGNVSETVISTLNLIDTVAPFIICPSDAVVQCDESTSPVNTGKASGDDECGFVMINHSDSPAIPGEECPLLESFERTWIVRDVCGNESTCIQTINVVDTVSPVFGPYEEVVNDIPCDGPLPDFDITVEDNCSANISVAIDEQTIEEGCAGTVIRTYTATDDCGNTSQITQTLNLIDTEAPFISTNLVDTTVECSVGFFSENETFQLEVLSPIDISGLYQTGIAFFGTRLSSTPIVGQLTLVDDGSGNPSDGCQALQNDVNGKIALIERGECFFVEKVFYAQEAGAIAVLIADSLDGDFGPPNMSAPEPDSTFVDLAALCIPTISVSTIDGDAIKAALLNGPVEVSLRNFDITLSDNCDENPKLTYIEEVVSGDCPQNYDFIRTWTVTDDCGNSSSTQHIITYEDTTSPELSVNPDATVECGEDFDLVGFEAFDLCSQVTTEIDSVYTPTCGQAGDWTITYTAIDECGNSTVAVQTISIVDTTPPSIVCPADVTIQCDESTMPVNTGKAFGADDCGFTTVNHTDEFILGDCDGEATILRTWIVRDQCENETTCVQTITVVDTVPPVFGPYEEVLNDIPCDGPLPDLDITVEDNCSTNITVTSEEQTIEEGCAGTVIRIYTATDDCGNSSQITQTLNLIDTEAPVISGIPEDLTIECTESFNTEEDLFLMEVNTPSGISGLYRTGFAFFGPNLTSTPLVGSVVRYEDGINVSSDGCESTLQDLSGQIAILFRRECFFATKVQNAQNAGALAVIVVDSVPPVFAPVNMGAPDEPFGPITIPSVSVNMDDGNLILASLDAGVNVTVTLRRLGLDVTDNCDQSPTLTYAESSALGDCPGNYTLFRTWTATDDCGNSSSSTQTITFEDTNAPFLEIASDATVECGEDFDLVSFNAFDDCSGVTVDIDSVFTTTCGPVGDWTITYTAIDGCGNSTIAVQTISIMDTTLPTIVCPDDVTIQCDESTMPVNTGKAFGEDDCGLVTVNHSDEVQFGDCLGERVITRTWTVRDQCENEVSCEQIITVVDTVAPVFTSVPEDVTLSCDEVVFPLNDRLCDAIELTVNADFEFYTNSFAFAEPNEVPGSCFGGSGTIQSVWFSFEGPATGEATVSTDFPNTELHDTQIAVYTLSGDCTDQSSLVEIGCDEDGGSAEPFGFTSIVSLESLTPGETYYVKVDSWNDAEGEFAIQVLDFLISTPLAGSHPSDQEKQSQPQASASRLVLGGYPTAFDNCSGTVINAEAVFTEACGESGTWSITYTATDNCGNTAIHAQTITLLDTTPPVFVQVPDDITLECDEDIPGDNTEGYSEASEYNGHFYYISDMPMTWLEASAAAQALGGNLVTINDAAENEFIFNTYYLPFSDIYIGLNDLNTEGEFEWVSGEPLEYSNWAAGEPNDFISGEDAVVMITSGFWNDISDLGEYRFVVELDYPLGSELLVEDKCSSEVVVTTSETFVEGDCIGNGLRTITYTATDECGNSSTASRTITIQDTTPPVVLFDQDSVQVECTEFACDYADMLNYQSLSIPERVALRQCVVGQFEALGLTPIGVEDNCSGDLPWEEVDLDIEVYSPCVNGITVAITCYFQAIDDCGNLSEIAASTMYLFDNTPPAIYCPADITVECGESTMPVQTGKASAGYECGLITINYSDAFEPACGQTGVITRTWVATDACGNVSTCDQVITIVDTTAPEFINPPVNIIAECDAIPAPATIQVSDNCGEVSIDYSEILFSGGCQGTIERAWLITDECGNSSIHLQYIELIDSTSPILEGVPDDFTIECEQEIPGFQVYAIDNCSTDLIVEQYEESTFGCGASYSTVYTFYTEDECGNTASASFTLTVVDTTAPIFEYNPTDLVLECGDTVPDMELIPATDNCSDSLYYSITSSTAMGQCSGNEIIQRTWTVTDECGNETSVSQTVTIIDTTPPTLIGVPGDIVLECGSEVPEFQISAVDDCSDSEVIIEEAFIDIFDGCSDGSGIAYLVIATDECGNTTEAAFSVTFVDTTPPIIAAAEDATVECGEDFDLANFEVSDLCSNVTVDVDSVFDGACGNTGVWTLTYTATDACGNSAADQQIITIIDTTPPVIEGVPDDVIVVECGSLISGVTISAQDNCSDVTLEYEAIFSNTCGDLLTETRLYIATDECGNSSVAEVIFASVDTTAPDIFCPPNILLACDDSIPAVDLSQVSVADICSTVTVAFEEEFVTSTNDQTVITRIFSATDDCGNISTCEQLIILDCSNQTSTCDMSMTATDLEVIEIGFGGTNPRVNATWTNPNNTTDCEVRGGRIAPSSMASGIPQFANMNNTQVITNTTGTTIPFNIVLYNNPNVPFVVGQRYGYEVRCLCEDETAYTDWSGMTPASTFVVPTPPSALANDNSDEAKLMENITINVFPNPGNGDEVNISILSGSMESAFVRVMDMHGKVVHDSRWEADDKTGIMQLNFDSPLSKGVYLIQLYNDSNFINERFIVE